MKKFGFLFFVLLAISYTQSEEIDGIDVNALYDNFTIIAKGMAETNASKCSNILIAHKKTLYRVIEAIIKNFNKQEKLEKILTAAALPLLMIPRIVEDCNIKSIIQTVPNLLKAEGIKQMGQNIIDNATELENLFKELFEATDDGKLIVIGKIIRKITGITFH